MGVLRDLGLTGQKIPESMKRDIAKMAEKHREVHMQMCRDQARKNLYFLYENSRDAKSWMSEEVLALQRDTGAEKVVGKDHTWMTNSKELAKNIRRHEGDWEKGVEGMRKEVVKRLWEATEIQMKRDGRIQEGWVWHMGWRMGWVWWMGMADGMGPGPWAWLHGPMGPWVHWPMGP